MEKVMTINVLKYVKETWPFDKYASNYEIKNKTADILGISKSAVYRILQEYNKTGTLKSATLSKKRPTLIEMIDDFDKSCIRRVVHGFYLKGESPTLKKVLDVINADKSLPSMGKTSLHKILKHLKFKYVFKRKQYSGLVDRNYISLWRIKYLKRIKQYREQERPIYYLTENWVSTGYTIGKVLEDDKVQSRRYFSDSLTMAKNLTSNGNRLIFLHLGGENGFVPESELILESQNATDYNESTAVEFKNWFQAMVLRVEPNAVVVMDNTGYHSRRQDNIPVASSKKSDIQEWLKSKNISFESDEIKLQLLEKVENIKSRYESYVVDEIAKQAGVEILRLPPHHCILNPIELLWADVKRVMPSKMTTRKMVEIKKLLQEALAKITADKWQNYISRVEMEESKLGDLDNNIDKTIDSFVFNVTDETLSGSSNSDTTESDSD